jgi:hypothetical protein
VLDELIPANFGPASFTIDFISPVSAFGFRVADTEDFFIRPRFTLFSGGVQIDQFTFSDDYDAETKFGLVDLDGFDRVVISPAFGGDGYGIAALTVGPSTTVIPVPAALPLLLTGALALVGVGRRRNG